MTDNKLNKWFQIIWKGTTIILFGIAGTYTGITAIIKFGQNIITTPAIATGEILGSTFIIYIIIKYIIMNMIQEIKKYKKGE